MIALNGMAGMSIIAQVDVDSGGNHLATWTNGSFFSIPQLLIVVAEFVGLFVNEGLLVVSWIAIQSIKLTFIEATILEPCQFDALEDG